GGILPELHHPAKAKRIIYLFQSGAPSHLDLFDHKPKLKELTNTELPASVRMGQRITGMTSGQKQLLCVGSPFAFKKHGNCGMEFSELLPNISKLADDVCLIRSMFTEPINHDPAVTFFGTGSQQPGRPTMGSWITYGLGSENSNLPGFVVLLSGGGGQPLQARYWGNGFLPGNYQGVQFRGAGDPELATHIENYELAYRMQTSVPELMDISKEPKAVLEAYGAEPGKASFANNCLLARRLAERGVRFIQLCH